MSSNDPAPFASADGVVVHAVAERSEIEAALDWLDRVEGLAGVPLVDEAERARVERAAAGTDRLPDWHLFLAWQRGAPVGYAGLVLGRDDATGDVAVAPDSTEATAVVQALLAALAKATAAGARRRVQAWLRQAGREELDAAAAANFAVARRLGVFGRDLGDVEPPQGPAGVTIRGFRPADADAVVAILRAAYAGTPEGDWTRDSFDARRRYDWFREEDLLVAERGGRLIGLHWLKRRGAGVGEVYNLAVDPGAQAGGLGGALLTAGLEHLRSVGCDEVILWADLANERATRLYEQHGFELRWQDVALERTVA